MFFEVVSLWSLGFPDEVLRILITSPPPGSGTLLTTLYNLLGYGERNGEIYQERGLIVLFANMLDTVIN
jgi:hypothetical protein